MADGIRIDDLTPTTVPGLLHEFPAMKDGLTVKLTLAQVQQLMLIGASNVALALKDLSNTVGPRGRVGQVLLASANYNDLQEIGIWTIPPGGTNAPEALAAYTVRVETSTTGYIVQYARAHELDAPADTKLYRREYNGGWTSWVRVREAEAELDLRYVRSATGSYRFKKVTRYTSSGTHTMDASTRLAIIKVQAAGGGGGGAGGSGSGVSAGGGGGSGSYVERRLTAGWAASETVTVGAAGTGGSSSGSNGSTASSSSFGTLAVATGGMQGGGVGTRQPQDLRGGSGGNVSFGSTATGGTSLLDVIIDGRQGDTGQIYGVGVTGVSGKGADSVFGTGGRVTTEGGGGLAGNGYGAGGSGGCEGTSTGRAGGNGAPGVVYVEEYE